MYKKNYNFGKYSELSGIKTSSDTFFTEQLGHGFLSEKLIPDFGVGMSSMLGGGFSQRASDCDTKYEEKTYDTDCGVMLDLPRYPLRFKALVPENGVYRVTLKIACYEKEVNSLFIYTMRRNLVAHNVHISAKETYTTSFLVHVCGYMLAASNVVLDEKAVYISIFGEPSIISAVTIEKAEGSTLFVAGDSTLTDQVARYPYYPKENGGGWAQVMLSFLNGDIALCNQAHSGMTGTCFREDGHWSMIEGQMKSGDLFMIQFGHNDQKRRSLSAFGGYSDNLRYYVNEVRARGAFPIIVTPICRSSRNAEGILNDALNDYAQACIAVGKEMNVPIIDLHAKSFNFINAVGVKGAKNYFCNGDVTHTNDFGSMKMASLVVDAAIEANIKELSQYFAIERPQDFAALYNDQIPKSAPIKRSLNEIPLPFVDIEDSPDLEWIKKAGKKGLLDICVMHLHPSGFLPRAQFAFIFMKAQRMATKSFSTSKYRDVKITEWESDMINSLRDENLIDETTTLEDCFRPDDFITGEETVSIVVRALLEKNQRGFSIEQCLVKAVDLGLIYEGFSTKAFITRGKIFRLLVSMMELSENSEKEMPSSIEVHPIG